MRQNGDFRQLGSQPTSPPRSRESSDHRRIGIIVPFRGEPSSASFSYLCNRLPAHLDGQGVEFHLLAVNQVDKHPFNRAALANVGVTILGGGGRRAGFDALDRRTFGCLAIHDVDRAPADSASNASCASLSAHYYSCSNLIPHVLHPESFTGGVLLVRDSVYRAVNGFSNEFWGWGHEDNDFYLRLRACGLPPKHPEGLDWCMEHKDCTQCKRAKLSSLAALRAETRSIARLQETMQTTISLGTKPSDGLSTVNFSTATVPVSIPCGRHNLHILNVELIRSSTEPSSCKADGGRHDDGCTAVIDDSQMQEALLVRSREALPRSTVSSSLLQATRSRVMYNFRYELDLQAHDRQKGSVRYRIAVCELAWQRRRPDVSDVARYRLLWRAVIRPNEKLHLAKMFDEYHGAFPCTLTEPRWSRNLTKLPAKQDHPGA